VDDCRFGFRGCFADYESKTIPRELVASFCWDRWRSVLGDPALPWRYRWFPSGLVRLSLFVRGNRYQRHHAVYGSGHADRMAGSAHHDCWPINNCKDRASRKPSIPSGMDLGMPARISPEPFRPWATEISPDSSKDLVPVLLQLSVES
jgi:hypothetical protein